MMQDNRQTVLIVDDTALNIQMLNELLQARYHVFFSTSGADALERIPIVKPDLILLDIMMPGMDGYEVCRRLKADPEFNDIPVIFITAITQEENETEGLKLGAVDYITKPFNPAIVHLRIKNQLELKLQRDILSRLSSLDGLTGLANRRYFEEYFEREWWRALRGCSPVSVLMIDVDFFKRFNDRYGHIAGDTCLKKVSAVLKNSLARPADLAARYGGEEFICLMPDTDIEGALHIARNILEAVRSLEIPHEDSEVLKFVSISIGAASRIPDKDMKPTDLVAEADKALYAAKNGGRNRVTAC